MSAIFATFVQHCCMTKYDIKKQTAEIWRYVSAQQQQDDYYEAHRKHFIRLHTVLANHGLNEWQFSTTLTGI